MPPGRGGCGDRISGLCAISARMSSGSFWPDSDGWGEEGQLQPPSDPKRPVAVCENGHSAFDMNAVPGYLRRRASLSAQLVLFGSGWGRQLGIRASTPRPLPLPIRKVRGTCAISYDGLGRSDCSTCRWHCLMVSISADIDLHCEYLSQSSATGAYSCKFSCAEHLPMLSP